MKKNLSLMFFAILGISLTGCANANNLKSDNLSSGNNSSNTTSDVSSEETLSIEENTPQYWKDLFTFDNVTIVLKNNLTIKRGDTYKCVGGKWYVKYQGREEYEPHNGRNIFDMFYAHYSVFTFKEEYSCYSAEGWDADGSSYLHYTNIYVTENKITEIDDSAVLNSSELTTNIVFSDYGTTTLED